MKLIKFYADPAIGFPMWGWAIRFMRCSERGFGVWMHQPKYFGRALYIAVWRTYRFEWARISNQARK